MADDGAAHVLAEVTLPSGRLAELRMPSKWTVDQVKAHCFKAVPELQPLQKAQYHLGLSAGDVLAVDFVRFVRAHKQIDAAFRATGKVRVSIFSRDVRSKAEASNADAAARRRGMSLVGDPDATRPLQDTTPHTDGTPRFLGSMDSSTEDLTKGKSASAELARFRRQAGVPISPERTRSAGTPAAGVGRPQTLFVDVTPMAGAVTHLDKPVMSPTRSTSSEHRRRDSDDTWVTVGSVASAKEKFRKLTAQDKQVPSPVRNTIYENMPPTPGKLAAMMGADKPQSPRRTTSTPAGDPTSAPPSARKASASSSSLSLLTPDMTSASAEALPAGKTAEALPSAQATQALTAGSASTSVEALPAVRASGSVDALPAVKTSASVEALPASTTAADKPRRRSEEDTEDGAKLSRTPSERVRVLEKRRASRALQSESKERTTVVAETGDAQTTGATPKKKSPAMTRASAGEELALRAMRRTSVVLDTVLVEVVTKHPVPASAPASAPAPAPAPVPDIALERTPSRKSLRFSSSQSNTDALDLAVAPREAVPTPEASPVLPTSESLRSFASTEAESNEHLEHSSSAGHSRTVSTVSEDDSDGATEPRASKKRGFHFGGLHILPSRKDTLSSTDERPSPATRSDDKHSLASKMRHTFLGTSGKSKKGTATMPVSITVPAQRPGAPGLLSPIGVGNGMVRSASEPDSVSIGSTSQSGERTPLESPRPRLEVGESRELGSRPLAHLRVMPTVQRTPEELAFALPTLAACKGWVIERPLQNNPQDYVHRKYALEPSEATGNRWFKEHFNAHKDARFYVGLSKELGPFVVCLLLDGKRTKTALPVYRALLRTQFGDDLLTFPASLVRMSKLRSRPTTRDLLKVIDARLVDADVALIDVPEKDLDKFMVEMVGMEEKQFVKSYKFGVLYVKEGQMKEEDMFGNEHGSPAFDRFLETIGDRIKLFEWKNFRAGLDTTRNTTGLESIYTKFGDYEVMLHVSTLLPYRKNDHQQLERKRHIGNDIGVIIYREGGAQPYLPNTIESEFNHVLAVVDAHGSPTSPDDASDRLTVSVATKHDVPPFGPPVPAGPVFSRDQQLRDFLLTKLINGENACFQAPTFASKIRRTRVALYKNLFDTYASKL